MQAEVIQRQYDEIIASHYDFDPQSVLGASLDRAMAQIKHQAGKEIERVLDLGMGTGRFLEKLRAEVNPRLRPYGLDLSQKMTDIACARIPDLQSAVDDAANLDAHFPGVAFDMVCTHFITGFVPAAVLAPKIAARLRPGGLWSLVGGTKAGFPVLQKKINSKFLKWIFKIKTFDVGEFVCNPADEAEVVDTLQGNGFTVRACETFRPSLHFKDLGEFVDFGYYGGWLTPFLEDLGLHRAKPWLKKLLNTVVFPVRDHHEIVIALAQKQ
jgi:ubiquinone/menaquinone biosynthesis C-methylase UbiE